MDPATVTVQLTLPDIKAFSKFSRGRHSWRSTALILLAGVLLSFSFVLKNDHGRSDAPPADVGEFLDDMLPALVPILIFVGVLVFLLWKAKQPSNYQKYAPSIFLPNTYTVHEEGLFCQNERGETLNYWKVVFRFVETPDHFFIMLAERNGHILPKRCFPTSEAAALFANQVRLNLEKYAPAALAAA
jgi:hypothetical protein